MHFWSYLNFILRFLKSLSLDYLQYPYMCYEPFFKPNLKKKTEKLIFQNSNFTTLFFVVIFDFFLFLKPMLRRFQTCFKFLRDGRRSFALTIYMQRIIPLSKLS